MTRIVTVLTQIPSNSRNQHCIVPDMVYYGYNADKFWGERTGFTEEHRVKIKKKDEACEFL